MIINTRPCTLRKKPPNSVVREAFGGKQKMTANNLVPYYTVILPHIRCKIKFKLSQPDDMGS